MKLYHMNYTRSVRPRWLLEEMNLDYELIKVSVKDIQKEEYKQIHPLGKIPVLIDEGVKIFESSAICMYLGDRYIEKDFAPNFDSPARAFYYQWILYASTTLDAPVEKYMFLTMPEIPENLLPFAKKNNLSQAEILNWFDRTF
ncbi:MAG: glutathione S-transferase family protein [Prochloraceae cyanobacterium]